MFQGILLLISTLLIFLLSKYLISSYEDKNELPICRFTITNPEFEICDNTKIANFRVYTKNKNWYYRDFPIGFKFYSNDKFRSKISISYVVTGDDEKEVIYDRIVEFEDTHTPTHHIYYINDIIVGSINISIETYSYYGSPTVLFEILQNNKCDLDKDYRLEIQF